MRSQVLVSVDMSSRESDLWICLCIEPAICFNRVFLSISSLCCHPLHVHIHTGASVGSNAGVFGILMHSDGCTVSSWYIFCSHVARIGFPEGAMLPVDITCPSVSDRRGRRSEKVTVGLISATCSCDSSLVPRILVFTLPKTASEDC